MKKLTKIIPLILVITMLLSILIPVASANETLIKDFVTRMYVTTLERQPDTGGLNYWINELAAGRRTGVTLAHGFVFSPEMIKRNLSNADFVEVLYSAFMGRTSDAGGKTHWVNRLNNGDTREKVFEGFVNSNEFTTICGNYGIQRGNYKAPPPTEFEIFAFEVFRLTNIERAKHGSSLLLFDDIILNKAAMLRAEEITKFLSHTRPDGRNFPTAYTDLGGDRTGRAVGENIAWFYTTPAQVVEGWMNSPGHRDQLLYFSHTHLGVGIARDDWGRLYWTQLFIG